MSARDCVWQVTGTQPISSFFAGACQNALTFWQALCLLRGNSMAAKKIVKFTLIGLCAIVIVAIAAVYLAGPSILEKVLARANEISQKSTGKALTFAKQPVISIIPLGVRFEGVRWGDDKSDLSVYAKSGHASVALGSIFSGTPEVQDVELQEPVVTIRQNQSGASLGPVAEADKDEKAKAVTEQQPASSMSLPISLRRLVLQDGKFTLVQEGGDEISISSLNLSIRNIGQGETGELECDFVAALQKATGEYIEANMALQGAAKLNLPEIGLPMLQVTITPVKGLYDRNLGPASFTVKGNVSLASGDFALEKLDAGITSARVSLKGTGNMHNPAFAGDVSVNASPAKLALIPALASVQSLTVNARADFSDNVLKIPSLAVAADKASLKGNLELGLSSLAIRGALHCSSLDVNALLGKQGQEKKDEAKEQAQASEESANTDEDTEDTILPDVNLTITGEGIVYNGVSVNKLTCTILGKNGNYTVSPLTAMVDGSAAVDIRAKANLKNSSYQTSGSVKNLSLATIQKAAAQDFNIQGTGSFNWDVSARGKNGDVLAKSAAGKGQVNLVSVRIPGITKAIKGTKQLSSIVLPEQIDSITVPFTLQKGHCLWNARLVSDGLGGKGSGDLDYVGKRIDANVDVTVQGQTIPLKINGPLSDISYSVDMEKLLKNMGKGLLQAPQNLRPTEGGIRKILPGSGGNPLKGLF